MPAAPHPRRAALRPRALRGARTTAALVCSISAAWPAAAIASDDGRSGASAAIQPTLGLPLVQPRMLGTYGEETWAYGTLDRVPALVDGRRVPQAPFIVTEGGAPPVFAVHTPQDGWRVVGQVYDAAGAPLSGDAFSLAGIRGSGLASMDPSSGAALLLGQQTTASGTAQVIALRDPDGRFKLIPSPAPSPTLRDGGSLLGLAATPRLLPARTDRAPEQTPAAAAQAVVATDAPDPAPDEPQSTTPQDPLTATGPTPTPTPAATSPVARATGRAAVPGGLAADEQLYRADRQVALAVREPSGRAGALIGVTSTGDVEDTVLHWDGSAWLREPIEVPAPLAAARLELVALAGTGLSDAWLLARASASTGAGLVLFRRDADGHWRQQSLGSSPFASAAPAGTGATGVEPLSQPGTPLTVSSTGLWIDGSFSRGGEVFPFTVYVDKSTGAVTGSWCDADDAILCQYRLGAGLDTSASLDAGYRSFAWSGAGRYGQRIITNPQVRRGASGTGRGTRLALAGTTFRRIRGLGTGGPDAAFRDPQEGWLVPPAVSGGAPSLALAQVTATPTSSRLDKWPVSFRRPLLSVATAPGAAPGDASARAVGVGIDGTVARYEPGLGWSPEFLFDSAGVRQGPDLRSVAWPELSRIHAVGSDGAMWMWRGSTGLWEPDASRPLDFSGQLMSVAFQPGNPERGYAVGRQGLILSYGKTWERQELPKEVSRMDITSVSFAGTRAYAVARAADAGSSALLVNDGDGWKLDPSIQGPLGETTNTALALVAGLMDGGVIVAGDSGVFKRTSPGADWELTTVPYTGSSVVALAAVRRSGQLRAIVSVQGSDQYPYRVIIDDDIVGQSPQILPAIDPPIQGQLLAETDAGTWSDETHGSSPYRSSAGDLGATEDQVYALTISPLTGQGWAVGGSIVRTDNDTGSTEDKAIRRTARVFRYPADPSLPAPTATEDEIDLSKPVARFAIGGHAACRVACADLSGVGLPADVGLRKAISRAARLGERPGGPRAFLYTGTRLESGTLDAEEAGQFAASAQGTAGLPFYGAAGADTTGDGRAPYREAFTSAATPFGSGALPQNVSVPSTIAGGTPGGTARTFYALDSLGAAGTVRVIVIDNSAGSLAAADALSPAGTVPQEDWLISALRAAKAERIPAIVIGNRDLDSRATASENVASDADRVAQILLQEGASAYFFDSPNANKAKAIPAGSSTTIPAFGNGTLGVSATQPLSPATPFYGEPGFFLAEVDTSARNATTNVAPVSVRLIPVVDEVALDATDGLLLRRSRTAIFRGLGRRPLMGGASPYIQFPSTSCKVITCAGRIDPEFTFTSSRPDVADFVARDVRTSDERVPAKGPDGRPMSDPTSALLCAFNAGTTTITIRTGGLAYSQQLTVQGGAVGQPCGTRVSSTPAARRPTQVQAPGVAPSAEPAGDTPPTGSVPIALPVPPPAVPAPAAPAANPPAPVVQSAFVPAVAAASIVPLAPLPPPTIARPLPPPPPGGVTITQPVPQVEEKREEEEAYESQSAYALSRAHETSRTSPASGGLLLALILIAAGASATGVSARRRPRPRLATARSHATLPPQRPRR